MKFGFGQALTRKEDDALLRGAGPLRRRRRAGRRRCTRWCCARRMRMRASASTISSACAPCRACGWCSPAPTWPSSGRCRRRACCRTWTIKIPVYPILASDVVRHVGDAVAFVVADTLGGGKGRRRSDRGRLAAAAACDRRRGGARARRAAGVGRPAGQSRLRNRSSATRRDQGGLRAGRAHGRVDHRQPAAGHQLHGYPRRDRRIRRQALSRSRSAARAATSSATSSAARCSSCRSTRCG